MSGMGKSMPRLLFVAGASEPPTPNPFSTEVRDPKFSPNGLRATGRSQRCLGVDLAISYLLIWVGRFVQNGLPKNARGQLM